MGAPLKTIFIFAFISLTAFFTLSYLSCTKDKCKSTVCANGGVCNGGNCTCAPGYEGFNCDTLSVNKFLGNWNVLEQGSVTSSSHYGTIIANGSNDSEVVITNFYNFFTVYIYAKVHLDTITIPSQEYQGKIVTGYGYMLPNTTYGPQNYIAMRYLIIDSLTNLGNNFGYLEGNNVSQWSR